MEYQDRQLTDQQARVSAPYARPSKECFSTRIKGERARKLSDICDAKVGSRESKRKKETSR